MRRAVRREGQEQENRSIVDLKLCLFIAVFEASFNAASEVPILASILVIFSPY
jgi:hypothetical protein